MKPKPGNATMKSLAISYIALGLLLTGFAVTAVAQDENPAPAVTAQTPVVVSSIPEPVVETPVNAEVPVAAPVVPENLPVEPAAVVAPTMPSAETPKVTDAATPAAAEKTEPVMQPETPAPAPAVEKPITPAPAAEKDAEFQLDRSSVNAEGAPAAEASAKGAASPQPEASLWSRLFGRKKDAPSTAAEAPAAAAQEQPSTTVAGGAASPSTAPANMAVADKVLSQEELVAAQEEVRRQAKEVEALKVLDQAYQAMGRNEFEAALKYFNQAMNVMPVRPHTVETRQKAMQSQAECEYRIALNYYKDSKYQEAKDAIRRALGYNPAHAKAARLSEQIKTDETRDAERKAMPVAPRHSAEYLDRSKQIRTSIDLGRQYYVIGDYEKARREFNNVLVLDEKNDEAAAWLHKLYDKKYNIETDQMDRQQAEMISQVRDTWTPPVKRDTVSLGLRVQEATITDAGKRRLQAKLNGITIPQLEFRQANIVDVIKYLDQASIACDKDSAPGEKGVNFILQLRRPGSASETAPAAAANGGGEGELTGEGSAVAMPANVPTVTLSLRNIVLIDAIKYITEVTGLKYRIEDNVVVITPSDVIYGELVTRTYKVQPSIAETIIGAAGTGGGGGDRMELGAVAQTVERGDVKKFFVDAGVPFPEGTSIVYKPSLNLLIAKNTADNLESFERILKSLNVVPVQVEIEARLVEVAQQDLEELGIEWLLTDNWELAENAGAGAAIPLAGRERIQVNQNTMTKGLRNLAQGASGITATPGGSLAGILSISSILTNPEVTMVLHALEQRSGANLLSAPKVTTKSGANAEIKVVQEYIYPTEFSLVTPAAAGSTQGSQVPMAFVQPEGFQTRDTGVILNVTPTVGPDGFSIDLVMLPQVCELTEWINYGTDYPNPSGDGTYFLAMPQPIFKSRTITTSITIWDGQTVVMGGLITEKQTTTLDKIPFLGDIPLLGYLFQSKTSNSQKFNLLIFVTANLVDPAGNKINKDLIASATGAVGASDTAAAAAP
ncbi:MAG: hypothetical protein PHW60_15210 [Kiritimatiellae bacterium]|nr:hypothetical protein [Kiritimatiellia bacterium]